MLKDIVRNFAIYIQDWMSDKSLSYSEIAEIGDLLRDLGDKVDLIEEFQENGLI